MSEDNAKDDTIDISKEIKKIKLKDKTPAEQRLYWKDQRKKKREENPKYASKYKRSLDMKKKYNTPPELFAEYREDLGDVLKIYASMIELNDGTFQKFLNDARFVNLDMSKKS